MGNEHLFWKATIDDLCNGYIYDNNQYICLICRATYEDGVIYPMNKELFEARKAIKAHIQEAHTSMFNYLLHMDKKYTGLSDHQKEILQYFYEGLKDKEIVKKSMREVHQRFDNIALNLKKKKNRRRSF